MVQYTLRRILLVIPVMIGVTLVVFFLMRVVPGDPAHAQLGEFATPEQLEAFREEHGLNQPLVVQYGQWVANIMQFDLGESLRGDRRPVIDRLVDRLPVTLELALISMAMAIVLGFTAGTISAVRQNTIVDYVSRVISLVGLAVPSFVMGSLFVLLPAVWWGWAPPLSWVEFTSDPIANLQMLILPAIALGMTLAGSIARMVRSSVLEVLRQDFVRTAHAKGLPGGTVLWRHTMRNALIPVVTILGLQTGVLLSGTIIIETIFGLPGLGRLMLETITTRDYQTLQGIVLLMSVVYVVINLVVDLSYAYIDPRIRYS